MEDAGGRRQAVPMVLPSAILVGALTPRAGLGADTPRRLRYT